jgi:hypothetical protein
MAPILVFVPALLWAWRRGSTPLQPLVGALAILVGGGAAGLLFLCYEFFGTTERYEVDFAPLFLLAGLAAWLTLSATTTGTRRRLVRVGGASLVAWGCLAGLAISFTGYYDPLPATHPATWRTLEDAGAPVSTAMAIIARRPILAKVSAPGLTQISPVTYTSIGAGVTAFSLGAADQAAITVVSPDSHDSALVVAYAPGPALPRRASLSLVLRGPDRQRRVVSLGRLPSAAAVRVPVHLGRGLNRFALSPLASSVKQPTAASPVPQPVMAVSGLALSAHR